MLCYIARGELAYAYVIELRVSTWNVGVQLGMSTESAERETWVLTGFDTTPQKDVATRY